MSGRLTLEAFDFDPQPGESRAAPEADADAAGTEQRDLAAYEKGYAAGWEDAVAAQAEDQTRIREDLARNLRDLSFSYHEARGHLLRGLEPLLTVMAERVLPELAQATLGAAIVAEVMGQAGHAAEGPVDIQVSPVNRAAIEAALGAEPPLPVRLVEEPALADGQVRFVFGEEERAFDMAALLDAIGSLVADFLNSDDERHRRHG